MVKLPSIINADLVGKNVLVRGDVDVPLEPFDDTRLKDILPTIEYILQNNAKIILCGHLGRPAGKVMPELSSKSVALWFGERMKVQVKEEKINDFQSFKVSDTFTVLENLRFDPREEANDVGFSRQLAGLADIFVNESFAESYKNVASIVGVPKILPHFAGLRFEKEVEILNKVIESSEKPTLVIIGGAKLDAKLPVIEKMATLAENVVVGGKLVSEYKRTDNPKITVLTLSVDGKDTSLDSIEAIKKLIEDAQTIVWNGPMGVVEDFTYQVGTRRVAELIVHNEIAFKVLGGGDTVGFVNKLGLLDKFNWVCSGGGSMLKFLSEGTLPGIEALR